MPFGIKIQRMISKNLGILLVLPVIPWPLRRNGMSLRFLPILEHLARTWQVDVLVLATQPEPIPPDWPPNLCRELSVVSIMSSTAPALTRKLKTALLGLAPWGIPFGGSPHVSRREIEANVLTRITSGRYSTVLWGAGFIDVVCRIRRKAPCVRFITDFIDSPSLAVSRARVDASLHQSMRSYTAWKLQRLERKVHRLCNASIYISPVDAASARSTTSHRIYVIPNGVSLPPTPLPQLSHPADRITVGFVGDMSYAPNVSAVLRLANVIFPRVRQCVANAELLIIGRRPRAEILRLQSDAITVTGEVQNIWEYISRVTVFVFPLTEGAGLQNKLLEAMHARVPVVSTSLVARGLQAVHEKHLLIADSDDEFVAQTLRLLSNPACASSLVENAADFIARQFSWPSILMRYETIIRGSDLPGILRTS